MSYNGPFNGRGTGPSGKPEHYFILKNSRGDAQDAARNAGFGKPIHHPAHEKGQVPHFHPVDRKGEKMENGQHFGYPQNTKFFK